VLGITRPREQELSEEKDQRMPGWAMPVLSWFISFYFLVGFTANVGFPPDRSLITGDSLFVFLWLFFLFLPFFKKIKIGKLLELEREVRQAKQELQDFKMEMRNSVAVLSTNVNTIGSMTNQITVNIPGLQEMQVAKEKVDAQASPEVKQEAEQVQQSMLLESEDTTMALARTRIEIERLLRKIVGKKTSVNELRNQSVRFYGIKQLFEMFIRENDEYSYLLEPFLYVTQVCNAAIHAQRVSDPQAKEALTLGAQVIAQLSTVAENAT
jgi:hypothetical protein